MIAQVRIRETDRQIAELTRKLTTVAPAQEERTEVKVFVNAAGAARCRSHHPLSGAGGVVDAVLRCAAIDRHQRPGAKLQLIRRASIQQRTGESWDDVQLALSTARPGAGSAAPILNPMTVDYAPDPPPQAQPRQPMGYGARLMDRDASGRADGQINHFAKSRPERPEAIGWKRPQLSLSTRSAPRLKRNPSRRSMPLRAASLCLQQAR